MKIIFLLTIITFSNIQQCFAQKTFNVTIHLDSTIDAKKISCSYDNGKTRITVRDTFINNILNLKGNYFSDLASLSISYAVSGSGSYSNEFFITKKPAQINLFYNPQSKDSPIKYILHNATPVYDTSSNKILSALMKYRLNEAQALSNLWRKHGHEMNSNDSIQLLHKALIKTLNEKTILFLKEHKNEYFSFWYFRNQVFLSSLSFFKNDTAYLNNLIVSMNSIFPKKYSRSAEGMEMIKLINEIINPVNLLNKPAPPFSIKDNQGKKIRLRNYKGNYILLDFWASWCVPCRLNNPVLQKIEKNYSTNNFVLISISLDDNIINWNAAIKKDSMEWINVSELKGTYSKYAQLYGVQAVPHYFLIDPSGKIILQTVNEIQKIEGTIEELYKSGFLKRK
jgi:thiol-disulfide isomerase/thioredoxin